MSRVERSEQSENSRSARGAGMAAGGGKKPKKKGKVRNLASSVILICLIGIFAVSAFNVYKIVRDYLKDRNAYSAVQDAAGVDKKSDKWDGNIDFDELRKINEDVVGWVYQEGTCINYPIVQGENNDMYLHTLFDGSAGGAGTIFVDYRTEKPFKQFNTIVYGHHMKDASMFAVLKYYITSDYAKEHPVIEIITPEKKYHMMVWACVNPPADSEIYTNNVSEEDAQDYLDWLADNAEYTTDVEVTTEDKIVELSTCAYEYDNARYVVVGKLVPWDEEEK